MNNKVKAIAFGAIFLSVGLCAKLGTAAIFSEKEDKAVITANIAEALPSENQAVEDILEIPGNKEPKTPDELNIQAGIVIDLSSGEKILSVNKTKRWPLASVSKMMASIVALEEMDLKKEITFSENAINTEGVAGSFQEGEIYTAEDLVYAMMVVSSNDAAVALMESMPEGEFVGLMNAKAEELGMVNTYFKEPSGLSMLNQSTANDVSLMLEYAWRNHPELFSISSKKTTLITEINTGLKVRLTNINALASRYDFLGGKTGYTEIAGENLAAVFSIDNKPTAIIILGAEDRVVETETIISFINNDINSSN
ncbi:MAG: serine hydrolase [Candidatus Colwellbacteria bacterium]|jgi:D-alanyl-D-alanine carboxypeptidase (penicillin-binding protein 5/6)|nr:serine hydrolase [Candidatus Colwellbacteria bacterium]MCK9497285.1 serine hydrolase [Candidatus Colwellbacteria bacterium]MDD3752642.1 serine hydrolase [Candidatus Colwellbacteria bacterium]MDD4818717.1 serine hydrolase [Candidatus Colwellbacteria bacterium]